MLQKGKAKLKEQPDGGATVTLSTGAAVEFPLDKTDQVFTILSEFGDGPRQARHHPGPLHNQIPQPDRTLDNPRTGSPTSTGRTTRTCSSAPASRSRTSTSSSRRATTRSTDDGDRLGQGPGNASTYGDNAVEDFGGAWPFIEDTGNAWYDAQSRPAGPPPRSRPSSPRSTSGTATTTTTTATSTSPTATSTTSRPCTPARARSRRRRPGRGRHLVAPLVRQPDRLRRHRPRRHTLLRRRPDRQHRLLDRRLHRRGRERRPRRVRARVRPRPRPARLLRHQRRRERHRLLDADVVRLVAEPGRRGDDIGTTPGYMGPWEKLLARLARLLRSVPRARADACTLSPARRASTTAQDQAVVVDVPDQHASPTTTTRRPRAATPGGPGSARRPEHHADPRRRPDRRRQGRP